MAEASGGGGKTKDGRRWSSAKQVLSLAANKIPYPTLLSNLSRTLEQRSSDKQWQDSRGMVLQDEEMDEEELILAAGGRRRSLSDSDLLVSPRSPAISRRVGFGSWKKSRNVVRDFTLYEEEEEQEEDALNMSGFIIYEEGTDTDSKESTGSMDRHEIGYMVNAILPSGERVKVRFAYYVFQCLSKLTATLSMN